MPHFCHLERQKCEKVMDKWATVKNIVAIIVVYIAKRSYVENEETKFSIFVKNVLNKYDHPIPLILLLSFP